MISHGATSIEIELDLVYVEPTTSKLGTVTYSWQKLRFMFI